MQFSISQSSDSLNIALSGTFRFDDHEHFKDVLKAIDAFGGTQVLINLGATNAVDSAGVGMLLLAHERAKKQNKNVSLKGATGGVAQVLAVTKIEKIMPILP